MDQVFYEELNQRKWPPFLAASISKRPAGIEPTINRVAVYPLATWVRARVTGPAGFEPASCSFGDCCVTVTLRTYVICSPQQYHRVARVFIFLSSLGWQDSNLQNLGQSQAVYHLAYTPLRLLCVRILWQFAHTTSHLSISSCSRFKEQPVHASADTSVTFLPTT